VSAAEGGRQVDDQPNLVGCPGNRVACLHDGLYLHTAKS
jgi:hypothetical protein